MWVLTLLLMMGLKMNTRPPAEREFFFKNMIFSKHFLDLISFVEGKTMRLLVKVVVSIIIFKLGNRLLVHTLALFDHTPIWQHYRILMNFSDRFCSIQPY
jgi:hypothetical protein